MVSQLCYLLNRLGIIASIGAGQDILMVTGKSEVEKIVPVVLHQDDQALIMHHITATNRSSYLMPKAFPAKASGFIQLRKTIGGHGAHDLRCRYTFQRLCEIKREVGEGSINRASVSYVINHLLNCEEIAIGEAGALAMKLADLVASDLSFDPITRIEQTSDIEGYVYDISVPDVERFIGGRSGLLLHNSANAAHIRELTTPSAVWLGVLASDIIKYKLPSDKLTEVDIKRLHELKADTIYKEKMWHDELDTFLRIKKKSEQEAFARYGLSYIVDTYLPEKLQLMKSA